MKHSTKKITFRCWHCKRELTTADFQTVTRDGETVAHTKCPHCGHTMTANYKPSKTSTPQ